MMDVMNDVASREVRDEGQDFHVRMRGAKLWLIKARATERHVPRP